MLLIRECKKRVGLALLKVNKKNVPWIIQNASPFILIKYVCGQIIYNKLLSIQ